MKETGFLQDKAAMTEKLHKLLFSTQITVEQMALLLNIARLRQYEAEEVLYKEGSKSQWLYFLLSGSISVLEDGEEVEEYAQPGSLVGVSILEGRETHKRSAVANKTSVCLAVDADMKKSIEEPETAAAYAVLYRLTSQIMARRAAEMEKEWNITRHELDIVKTNLWNS